MAVGRVAHVVELWGAVKEGWVAKMLTSLYGLLGFVSFLVANLNPTQRTKWEDVFLIPNLIPHWSAPVWVSVGIAVLAVGVFEGSFVLKRRDASTIANYEASNPRIVVTEAEKNDMHPFVLHVRGRVVNPGEPTILSAWSVAITFSNGVVIHPILRGDDSYVCPSYEATASGKGGTVSHATTPLRSGGVAEAALNVTLPKAVYELPFDGATRFTLRCLTIKNVQIEGSATFLVSEPEYVFPPDDPMTTDDVLDLPRESQRTNAERLVVARNLFAELAADPESDASKSRIQKVGRALMLLSRDVNGMTASYVEDWTARLAGLRRAGIKVDE